MTDAWVVFYTSVYQDFAESGGKFKPTFRIDGVFLDYWEAVRVHNKKLEKAYDAEGHKIRKVQLN